MAVWAIGDIHGCYSSFKKLLEKIEFNPSKDKLWLSGDIVNRGKESLRTIEYIYSIRESVIMVLGNHDISLINAYFGLKKPSSYTKPILESKNAKIYIDWLRNQKFLHISKKYKHTISHAGISPEFDLNMAQKYASSLELKLRSDDAKEWLEAISKIKVDKFDNSLSKLEKDKYILDSFISMRYCYHDNRLNFKNKVGLEDLKDKELIPWFKTPTRKKIDYKILFGHWSTLGYYNNKDVCCIDSSCVWGERLTAYRVDKNNKIVNIECN
ncbi:Bis(5'-nucleosyl)-tetraphosphatase, symmetrical [hydrothermal vent metagenome]|uniref:bis(5'-nucleosyl)-tetraphosphatase (symmetrical) n=1 Tax=hydrothermal vent metagenome TaxID=652676 RepID=A0A1W1EKW4_9ZZZZ